MRRPRSAAREVIARLPHRPAGYISLTHVHKFREDDGTLAEVESQIAGDEINDAEKTALHYAAGKICDDLGYYDRAFKHFDSANREAHKAFDLYRGRELQAAQEDSIFRRNSSVNAKAGASLRNSPYLSSACHAPAPR